MLFLYKKILISNFFLKKDRCQRDNVIEGPPRFLNALSTFLRVDRSFLSKTFYFLINSDNLDVLYYEKNDSSRTLFFTHTSGEEKRNPSREWETQNRYTWYAYLYHKRDSDLRLESEFRGPSLRRSADFPTGNNAMYFGSRRTVDLGRHFQDSATSGVTGPVVRCSRLGRSRTTRTVPREQFYPLIYLWPRATRPRRRNLVKLAFVSIDSCYVRARAHVLVSVWCTRSRINDDSALTRGYRDIWKGESDVVLRF